MALPTRSRVEQRPGKGSEEKQGVGGNGQQSLTLLVGDLGAKRG